MHRRARKIFFLAIAAALCSCFWLIIRIFQSGPQSRTETLLDGDCVADISFLRADGLQLTPQVDYTRLEIELMRSGDVHRFAENLDIALPELETISLRKTGQASHCHSTSVVIPAPIPSGQKTDASHILFGVATTLDRLVDSLDTFAVWASGTGSRIIAVIEPHPDRREVEQRADGLGFTLAIIESDSDFLDRYFSLVRHLYHRRDGRTEWAALIDDDTFFPSMSNLLSRLSLYDTGEPQYVGALSEDFEQLHFWGFMAYGGGGIFLSVPLLRKLNEDDVYDACSVYDDTGDRRLAQCIYSHTTTKISWEKGLRQLDLHGNDLSGFYESGRALPLSLHHWKSWYPLDMVAMSAVTSVCGDTCLLHRWHLSDDWYLTNGFSLVKYSTPLMENLTMEQTWDDSGYKREGEGFAHSLAPLRSRDDGKISFRLRAAVQEGSVVQQIYVRQPRSQSRDQVVEILWRVV